jgi:hypothetical protein
VQRVADDDRDVHDVTLIDGLARAFYWQHLLDTGAMKSGSPGSSASSCAGVRPQPSPPCGKPPPGRLPCVSPFSVPDRGKQLQSTTSPAQTRKNAGGVAENAHEASRETRRQRGGKDAETGSPGWVALTRHRRGTAPTLAFRAEKNPTESGWVFGKWWRIRDSNPGPADYDSAAVYHKTWRATGRLVAPTSASSRKTVAPVALTLAPYGRIRT